MHGQPGNVQLTDVLAGLDGPTLAAVFGGETHDYLALLLLAFLKADLLV
jgi:hypothetical protein